MLSMGVNVQQVHFFGKAESCMSVRGHATDHRHDSAMLRIKEIRESRPGGKVTLVDLQNAAGIDSSLLSRYENGKAWPEPKRLAKIAKALGVSVAELIADYSPIKGDVLALAYELQDLTPEELRSLRALTEKMRERP